jgi:phosphoribosylanthranilate isomerase
MTRVKICGMTNLEDALLAVDLGADALGFIFAPSPRRVTVEQAREVIHRLPPFVTRVGVFVDSDLQEVQRIMAACSLDMAQLHGRETPDYCRQLFPRAIKSFRVRDASSLGSLSLYNVSAYLLDSYVEGQPGGTGRTFDWSLALEARRHGPVIIGGGLSPDNVRQAIAAVHPYGVDVCSGVEARPGKKDPQKVRRFIEEVRAAS